jgi:signal transduction histidine kinase
MAKVSDDGIVRPQAGNSSGLRGLADCVEALGGHLTINSQAGQDTRLTAQLPVS